MKKLICADDVTKAHEQGTQTICIDSKNTIITPSARDMADTLDLKFEEGAAKEANPLNVALPKDLTKETLVEMLRAILAGDTASDKPYIYKKHSNGLKTVDGSSVKMDVFETGNPNANVHFQEIISKEESHISAGFLEIDHSNFDWELTYEEIDYVIDGTLTIAIDGTTYTATAGDVVFVPKGSKVTWGSPDKARIFYATYPANWADLV